MWLMARLELDMGLDRILCLGTVATSELEKGVPEGLLIYMPALSIGLFRSSRKEYIRFIA